MTCALAGRIKEIKVESIVVEDLISKDLFDVKTDSDELLRLKEGQTALFVGEMSQGILWVTRISAQRFLEPLFEDELMEISGKYALIQPENNPFDLVFASKGGPAEIPVPIEVEDDPFE